MAVTSRKFSTGTTSAQFDRGKNFVGGINTSYLTNASSSQMRKCVNFDIGKFGNLITRDGVTLVEDLNDSLEFSRLLKYDSMITEYYLEPNTKSSYTEINQSVCNEVKEYTMDGNIYDYDQSYVSYIYGDSYIHQELPYIKDPSVNYGTYVYFDPDGKEINYYIQDSLLVISKVDSQGIRFVYGTVIGYDENLIKKNYNYRGSIELAIVLSPGETNDVQSEGNEIIAYLRYSKVSGDRDIVITKGKWKQSLVIHTLVGTSFKPNDEDKRYLFEDYSISKHRSRMYLKTSDGLFATTFTTINGVVEQSFINTLADECSIRYKPNAYEISVLGANLLSPHPNQDIQDVRGTVTEIIGLIITGVDERNKIKPFKTNDPLYLKAMVSYNSHSSLSKLKYRWSYDYLGSEYTTSIERNVYSGEFKINEDFSNDHKEIVFTPRDSGIYRFYCEMTDNDQESKKPTFNKMQDTEIQATKEDYNGDDSTLLYKGLVQSQIMKPFKKYFVIGGSSFTSAYSNILYMTLSDNPLYVPLNYIIQIPNGDSVIDFVEYRESLIIFTTKSVYRLDGDIPYVLKSSSTIANSQKSFTLKKLLDTTELINKTNVVLTNDGILTFGSRLIKYYYTSGNMLASKDLSFFVDKLLPEDNFNFIKCIDLKTYLVKDDKVLIHEVIDYNVAGTSDRFFVYDFAGLIPKGIFKINKIIYIYFEDGRVAFFNSQVKGFDFELPFNSKVRTVEDAFGNENLNKKFKSVLFSSKPISGAYNKWFTQSEVKTNLPDIVEEEDYTPPLEDGEDAILDDRYAYMMEKYNNTPDDMYFFTRISDIFIDVFVDNKVVVDSEYLHFQREPRGGYKLYKIKTPNGKIDGDFTLSYTQKTKEAEYLFDRQYESQMSDVWGGNSITDSERTDYALSGSIPIRMRGQGKTISVELEFNTPVVLNGITVIKRDGVVKGDYRSKYNNQKRGRK